MKPGLASLFALAFTFFAVAVGQQKNSSWQEYTYPTDGFAITAPVAPKPQPSPALPGATVYPIALKDEDATVVLRVKATPNCDSFLTLYRKNLVAGMEPEVDLSSLKDVTLSDHPGLEYKRKVHANTVVDRWYCTDRHLYAFSVNWSSSKPFPAGAARVLDSFRLLAKTDPRQ
jgi:hypothetical protein